MRRISLIVALSAGLAVGVMNHTQLRANPANGSDRALTPDTAISTSVHPNDTEFVNELTIASMSEVDLGRMAVERALDPAVKSFGQMMIDDHSVAGQKLGDIAHRNDIQTPADMGAKHRDLRSKLSGLQGPAFDREYMDAMVQGHKEVMDRLESRLDHSGLDGWKIRMDDIDHAKTSGFEENAPVTPQYSDNPVTMEINSWAAESYPVVYAHHKSASTLADRMKPGPSRTQ